VFDYVKKKLEIAKPKASLIVLTKMEKKKKSEDTEQVAVPKQRKVSSGPLRDKSRTMARMVEAVGKVIQKKGYTGLTAPNIALAAGVDKKLVWTYFGGIDNLIEVFLQSKDFLKTGAKPVIDDMLSNPNNVGAEEFNKLLQAQLTTLMKDRYLHKIIHWELGEDKKVLRIMAEKREEIGEGLLKLIDPQFTNTDVNIRAIAALLLGGVYFLTLHAKNNGSTICGININEEQGRIEIEKTIQSIVYNSFEKAKSQK